METITGLSVETMSGGALIERFDAELRKAVDNILDVNTSDKKSRKVTCSIVLTPSGRDRAKIEIQTTSTLAPYTAYSSQIFFGKDATGAVVGMEQDPNQIELPFKKEEEPVSAKIVSIGGKN